jgi:hypothetical protein
MRVPNSFASAVHGVRVEGGSSIVTGGTGTVTVAGTGGNGTGADNHGVIVVGAGSAITASDGAVIVTGSAGSRSQEASGVKVSGEGK